MIPPPSTLFFYAGMAFLAGSSALGAGKAVVDLLLTDPSRQELEDRGQDMIEWER